MLADTSTDDGKTQETLRSNVIDFRDWLMKQLSALPKAHSNGNSYASRNYASLSKRSTCFTANQFNQARKSDWAKSQVMDGLSTLSQQLAKTAGTAFAQNSAGQLNQYATQLKQSDDPQFQQIGILYTQEAQALQNGNIQAADQAANQVSAVPKPYVPPGYQPTQGESQLVSAFNQVIGTVIAGLGGILGTFAVSQILQALGIPNLASLLGTGQVAGTSLGYGPKPLGGCQQRRSQRDLPGRKFGHAAIGDRQREPPPVTEFRQRGRSAIGSMRRRLNKKRSL